MQFTIKAAPFGAALTNVMPHAGTDDTLPVLRAVRVRLDEDGDIVVDATDRYSLGEQVIDHDHKVLADGFEPGQALIPLTLVKEIVKQAKAAKLGFLNVNVAEGRVTVEYPGGSLTGQTQEGEFPKVETLWNAAESRTGTVDRIGLGAGNIAKFVKLVDDAMRPIKNPCIDMRVNETAKPAIVRVTQLEQDFRALLMPVRLSDEKAAA